MNLLRRDVSIRVAECLESRSRLIIALAAVVTLILIIPYLLLPPDVEASQDPGGEVFDLRDDVESRFESEIHGIAVLIESRTGDILTRDGLLPIYENSRKLRDSDDAGELTPDGLPVQSYLLKRFNPDTNSEIHGTTSIADHAARVLALDPRLNTTLAEATDDQVKFAIHQVFANPDGAEFRESLSVQESSETRVLNGEEFTAWSAPAVMTFVLADNEKLGGGTQRTGLGADETVRDKERFNRKVQEILRGDEAQNRAWGIAIDVTLETDDEGATAGVFIMFTVIAAVLVVGLAMRSYWSMALTGVGLAILMIWLKGISNLIGLEGGLIVELIVPVAMISLGVDFAVHALKRYEEEKRLGLPFRRALSVGLGGVLGALVLAMASDSLAFLANTSSGVDGVVQFGIAAAIAVLSSFVVLGVVVPLAMCEIDQMGVARTHRNSLISKVAVMLNGFGVAALSGAAVVFIVARGIIPTGMEFAILAVAILIFIVGPLVLARRHNTGDLDLGSSASTPTFTAERSASGALVPIVAVFATWRFIVLPLALAITAIAVLLALRLEATFDVKDFFDSSSDFVVSLDKLDEHVADRAGEQGIIYLMGDLTDPAAIGLIDTFIDQLANNTRIARESTGEPNVTESIVSLIQRVLASPFASGAVTATSGVDLVDADGDGLPDSTEALAAILEFITANGLPLSETTMAFTSDQVRQIVDYNPGAEDVTIFSVFVPGTRKQENITLARTALESDFAIFDRSDSITFVGLTGSPFARQAQLKATTKTLQRSIPIAAVGALILLLIAMRSVRYAVVTIIPIGLVVTWLYAVMYVSGFAFNFVTATIGAISIGVGIDYSIHMTQRFREELDRSSRRMEALHMAVSGTGAALVASALSSIVGFGILGFAPMPMFSSYGFLTAIMIALALAASLIVLPSLLILVSADPSEDGSADPKADIAR